MRETPKRLRQMVARAQTLAEVADELRYDGKDRKRSVLRLFKKYRIPLVRRDRNTWLVLPNQKRALWEVLTCLPSENEAACGIAAVESVSAKPCGKSKSTLRDAIDAKLPKPTGPGSSTNYSKSLFTALPGGRAS